MVRVDWLEVAKGLGDRGDAAAAAACVGVGEVLQRDVAEAVAEDEVVGAEARVAELGADAGDVVPRGADEVDRLENREGGGRRVVRREGKFFFCFAGPIIITHRSMLLMALFFSSRQTFSPLIPSGAPSSPRRASSSRWPR